MGYAIYVEQGRVGDSKKSSYQHQTAVRVTIFSNPAWFD